MCSHSGAPVDFPPCILHRLFLIAGDWHGFSLRVRAPHFGLWCIGNLFCMGLFLKFFSYPPPFFGLDGTNHRLPASMHVDVLHCHLLLTLATMPVESLEYQLALLSFQQADGR